MGVKKFTHFKNLLFATALVSGIFSGTHVKAQVTTITYNGAAQTYTVGPGVGLIQVELWGAQGGTAGGSNGGLGAYTKGTMTVTQGEVLNVYVGGQSGFNGGGTAGSGGGLFSATGGGGTDIRRNGNTFADRVAVAGGGGGAGRNSCNTQHGGIGGFPGGLGGNGDGAIGGSGTVSGGGDVSGGYGCNQCCSSSRGGGAVDKQVVVARVATGIQQAVQVAVAVVTTQIIAEAAVILPVAEVASV